MSVFHVGIFFLSVVIVFVLYLSFFTHVIFAEWSPLFTMLCVYISICMGMWVVRSRSIVVSFLSDFYFIFEIELKLILLDELTNELQKSAFLFSTAEVRSKCCCVWLLWGSLCCNHLTNWVISAHNMVEALLRELTAPLIAFNADFFMCGDLEALLLFVLYKTEIGSFVWLDLPFFIFRILCRLCVLILN